MSEDNVQYGQDLVADAAKILLEKGLSFPERHRVMQAFRKQGRDQPRNAEYKHKDGFWTSTHEQLRGYGFNTEKEVNLINAMHDLAPDISGENLIQIMSITLKLMDVEGDWTFKAKH